MTDPHHPVLLYDGGCGLCNAVVGFLLRHDPPGRVHFAPLQSAPAQEYLKSVGLPTDDFDSLVFVPAWHGRGGAYLLRTDGALAAFAELGGRWRKLASAARLVPRALRDGIYRLVSRTRYALFGEYRPKPLPNPKWEQRFLAR
jgi:predicted DCC family thiol-disulfide oxidoreductase YuxK